MENFIEWLYLYGPTVCVGVGAIISTIADRRNNRKGAAEVKTVIQSNYLESAKQIETLNEQIDLLNTKLAESEARELSTQEKFNQISRRLARMENKIDRRYSEGSE